MIRIAVFLLIAVPSLVLDEIRYRAGKVTLSTYIRGESAAEPVVPCLIGVVMVLGCIAMAWGQPPLAWANGYLSGGFMWALIVHWFLNNH